MEAFQKKLKDVRCFLLDMDGTVYVGDRLIGDMKNTLQAIRASGRKIVFLTNNSSKSAKTYEEKLNRLGIFEKTDEIYTSGMATARYLNLHFAGKSVYLVGTDALKEEFLRAKIPLTEERADVVVLGYDTTLTYEKLCKITNYIKKGAYYIATHPDMVCPAPDESVPDVGSFIRLIEGATGRVPDVICGKPYPAMGEAISATYRLKKEELLMAGDRLNTDIAFALNNGFFSLLVYSGEATVADYEKGGETVDLALASLNEIVPYL